MNVVDVNGNTLNDGDTVKLTKDLKVKGAGMTLKRGTVVKNISLRNMPKKLIVKSKKPALFYERSSFKKCNCLKSYGFSFV